MMALNNSFLFVMLCFICTVNGWISTIPNLLRHSPSPSSSFFSVSLRLNEGDGNGSGSDRDIVNDKFLRRRNSKTRRVREPKGSDSMSGSTNSIGRRSSSVYSNSLEGEFIGQIGGRGDRGSTSGARVTVDDHRGRPVTIRHARVARLLQVELSTIISKSDVKALSYPDNDLLASTTIMDVDLSPDLSYAKVFISVLGNAVEKRQVYVWLCQHIGQVRYSLAKRLRHMKKIPDIHFKLFEAHEMELASVLDGLSMELMIGGEIGGLG